MQGRQHVLSLCGALSLIVLSSLMVIAVSSASSTRDAHRYLQCLVPAGSCSTIAKDAEGTYGYVFTWGFLYRRKRALSLYISLDPLSTPPPPFFFPFALSHPPVTTGLVMLEEQKQKQAEAEARKAARKERQAKSREERKGTKTQ